MTVLAPLRSIKIESDCPTCNGTGETFDGKKWVSCGTCDGSGTVTEDTNDLLSLPQAGPSGGDPNAWCTATCSTSGCDAQCSGNRGHSGSHACFSH